MKNDVLKLLRSGKSKPKEKFNKAMSLFRNSKGANPMLVRNYNQMGYSPEALKNICYDLQQLHGISDKEVRSLSVVSDSSKDSAAKNKLSEETAKALIELDPEKANYNKELKPLAKKVSDELEESPKDQKKATLIEFLTSSIVIDALRDVLDLDEDEEEDENDEDEENSKDPADQEEEEKKSGDKD